MDIITEAEVEETVETANENLKPSFDYKKDLTMSWWKIRATIRNGVDRHETFFWSFKICLFLIYHVIVSTICKKDHIKWKRMDKILRITFYWPYLCNCNSEWLWLVLVLNMFCVQLGIQAEQNDNFTKNYILVFLFMLQWIVSNPALITDIVIL